MTNSINENSENLISEIKASLDRLKNSKNNENQTKLLKHAETILSSLSAGKNQIIQLVQDSQKSISDKWDTITDLCLESELTKQELEKIKAQIAKIEEQEFETQSNKNKLSKQLRLEERELNSNKKNYNKNEKKIEQLNSKINLISNLDNDSNDSFITNLFNTNNNEKARRLSRILSDRTTDSDNLVQKIQLKQDKIDDTAGEIDLHNQKLNELQNKNIELRQTMKHLMDCVRINNNQIRKTEMEIERQNKNLKSLSLSLVDIANETSRQHSIYQKSLNEPLSQIEFEILLENALPKNGFKNDITELLITDSLNLDVDKLTADLLDLDEDIEIID